MIRLVPAALVAIAVCAGTTALASPEAPRDRLELEALSDPSELVEWANHDRTSGYYKTRSSPARDGGGGCSGAGWLVILLPAIAVGAGSLFGILERSKLGRPNGIEYVRSPAPIPTKVDISALSLAIDAGDRAWLEQELTRLRGSSDTSTAGGRLAMLRGIALALRRCKSGWRHAGVIDAEPMLERPARALFDRTIASARAGEAARDAGSSAAPGDRLFVITMAFAARSTLTDFGAMKTVEDVRAWLETLHYLPPGSLLACDVVLVPADPADALSSIELEARYPTMKKLRAGTVTGRIQCEYCYGFFPGELLTCPHCGGKAGHADAA